MVGVTGIAEVDNKCKITILYDFFYLHQVSE